nr:ensconsin-like [Nicotiana tomentosiformis]
MAPKYGWKVKNHELLKGSVMCLDIDALDEPDEAELRGSAPDHPPSPTTEPATTTTPFTPSVSSSSAPAAPYPPAPVSSSPPTQAEQIDSPSSPRSLDHENLGSTNSAPTQDPQRRRSVVISVATSLPWVKLHDTVTTDAEHESAFMEQISNLEVGLRAKIEEASAAEEKRAKMEERLKKVTEHNRLHSTTNVELESKISTMKAENEELQAKIDKLRAKLQDEEDSILFEKTYSMYHMKRTTLEEAKEGITNIDGCIAKARELEIATCENLPSRPTAFDSSNTNSKYSGSKVETEEDEGPKPASKHPSSTRENDDPS